jgi:hypothetical protein
MSAVCADFGYSGKSCGNRVFEPKALPLKELLPNRPRYIRPMEKLIKKILTAHRN